MNRTIIAAMLYLAIFSSSYTAAQTISPISGPDQEIDIHNLSLGDIQIIQDALIWKGGYFGLKDGRWGSMTEVALARWRSAHGYPAGKGLTVGMYANLIGGAWQLKDEVGFEVWLDPRTGSSFGYPSKLVAPEPNISRNGTDYKGTNGILIRTLKMNGDTDVRGLLNNLIKDTSKNVYRLDKPNRQVLSMSDYDWVFYLRYDRVGTNWVGFDMSYKGQSGDRDFLIAATSANFGPDGTPVWAFGQPAPLFQSVLRWVEKSKSPNAGTQPAEVPKQTEAQREIPDRTQKSAPKVTGAGTGFYLSSDGSMITAAHVVAGCQKVSLIDGTSLQIVASDNDRDIALLRAGSAPHTFLKLRRDQTLDLGERVYLFGYPYFGNVSTGLNMTEGIVTSLRGAGDNPLHFQFSAGLQPGNSGGPVIDSGGAVIGVAVARLNDSKMFAATGTIPQTMNYAVRGAVLESFLLEHGVLPEKAVPHPGIEAKDVSRSVAPSITPVLCWE